MVSESLDNLVALSQQLLELAYRSWLFKVLNLVFGEAGQVKLLVKLDNFNDLSNADLTKFLCSLQEQLNGFVALQLWDKKRIGVNVVVYLQEVLSRSDQDL